MTALILSFLISNTAVANEPACLDGYFDLGARAASMGFACVGPEAPKQAVLVFCHRETLLKEGRCTGEWHQIRCEWLDEGAKWECRENGDYPFQALIFKLSDDRIRYEFKSSFNEGVLEGTRIK